MRKVEGKTRIICEVTANPKLVDFTWMLNNATLTADLVHMGLQSILTVDAAAHTTGVYFCYANNSAGVSTPCEINIEGSGGLLAKFGDENIIIIIAVVAAAIVMILVVCIVLMVICRRKRAEEKCKSLAVTVIGTELCGVVETNRQSFEFFPFSFFFSCFSIS